MWSERNRRDLGVLSGVQDARTVRPARKVSIRLIALRDLLTTNQSVL